VLKAMLEKTDPGRRTVSYQEFKQPDSFGKTAYLKNATAGNFYKSKQAFTTGSNGVERLSFENNTHSGKINAGSTFG